MKWSILLSLALLCSLSVALALPISDSTPYWVTNQRDHQVTGSQAATYSGSWQFIANQTVNYSVSLLSNEGFVGASGNGYSPGQSIVFDMNNDGSMETITWSNSQVFLHHTVGSAFTQDDIYTPGATIVSVQAYYPTDDPTSQGELAVLTIDSNTTFRRAIVHFLTFDAPNTGFAIETKTINVFDRLFARTSAAATSILNSTPNGMKCLSATQNDNPRAVCFIEGQQDVLYTANTFQDGFSGCTNSNCSVGVMNYFAIFAPALPFNNPVSGDTVSFTTIKPVSTTTDPLSKEGGPFNLYFNDIQFAYDPFTIPSPYQYGIYFYSADRQKAYRIDFNYQFFESSAFSYTYDPLFGGMTGLPVGATNVIPINCSSNYTNSVTQTPATDFQDRQSFLLVDQYPRFGFLRFTNKIATNATPLASDVCIQSQVTIFDRSGNQNIASINDQGITRGLFGSGAPSKVIKLFSIPASYANTLFFLENDVADGGPSTVNRTENFGSHFVTITSNGGAISSTVKNFNYTFPYLQTGASGYQSPFYQQNTIGITANTGLGRGAFADNNLYMIDSNIVYPNVFVEKTYLQNASYSPANVAYGNNLELLATQNKSVIMISYNINLFTIPSLNFTAPYFDPNVDPTHALWGYNNISCINATQTFITHICDGSHPCSYFATTDTPVRLVSDCASGGANYTYGAFSTTQPGVQCTAASSQQTMHINFWIQTQDSLQDFSQATAINLPVQVVNCGASIVEGPLYLNNTAPSNGTSGSGGSTSNPDFGAQANSFLDTVFGGGYTTLKAIVGIIFVIALVVIVAQMEAIKKMNNSLPVIIVVGALGFILVTLLKLIAPFVLILALVMLTLIFIVLRNIMPANSGPG